MVSKGKRGTIEQPLAVEEAAEEGCPAAACSGGGAAVHGGAATVLLGGGGADKMKRKIERDLELGRGEIRVRSF